MVKSKQTKINTAIKALKISKVSDLIFMQKKNSQKHSYIIL